VAEGGGVIRGVVFDFGNVISSFDPGKFFSRLREWSGLPVETLREKVYGSGLHSLFERGKVAPDDFRRRIETLTGAAVPAETFAEAYTDIFTPIEGTHAILRSLAGKVRLGLLSNTNEWHFRRHIRNVPVFPLFDAVTLSYEVGTLKPDPEIYRDALRKISLPPGECAYVDDIGEYADGAAVVGMRGIRCEGPARLREELANLGLDSL